MLHIFLIKILDTSYFELVSFWNVEVINFEKICFYKFYVTKEEIKAINNMTTNKVKAGDILIIPHKQKWTADMIRKIMVDETQIGTLVQGK